ncbi:OmpA family protein [Chromobacterium vaccinii]|uniref:OmpA family protein n=1 Tax=Chromobacterium vaccinii TaxID=1108595 RepID=UPI000E1220F1|nr:OmpA family protein [Chromobacterium vaccinii]SUX55872.1 Inner membrane lipoprotein YiaD precursor [Chromobacterium vaccinii]
MMKNTIVSMLVAVSVAGLSGCANMSDTQKGVGGGAAIGAGVGAAIGALTAGGHGGRSAATGAAIGGLLGAGGGYLWSQHMQKQKEAMEQATKGTGIGVSQTADNRLKLNIPADASFATNSYALRPSLKPVLDKLATTLQQNPVTSVNIIGHTDNTGSDAINNPLSVNRAKATQSYIASRGVDINRIGVDGRGSREPVADNGTVSGRAMNRRVEIFVAEPAQQK